MMSDGATRSRRKDPSGRGNAAALVQANTESKNVGAQISRWAPWSELTALSGDSAHSASASAEGDRQRP
jgi:hypothetical protein